MLREQSEAALLLDTGDRRWSPGGPVWWELKSELEVLPKEREGKKYPSFAPPSCPNLLAPTAASHWLS